MNELIKVNYDNDRPTISGRELHEFLEVESNYTTWFKRMCEYGFTEEIDFIPFLEESTGGRPSQDHQLTIDMAKEICMLQRTEKGKQARQYFIALEKAWNTPEMILSRALKVAEQQMKQLQIRNSQLTVDNQ
ncbi:MAG TPA: antA/AntB antirepressor family protein, partial [Candidatus Coprocola pullicola]|nr:antA/AntB antirepressor family protein [Candidatus Coprocola pullicola]